MRILHTSDWHLGHTLHDLSREHEHDRFLTWLACTLEAEAIDALIIAGDVFDTANPPASAHTRWYRFLAEIRTRLPGLDVVVIGGNHDSAARLDAPVPLLAPLRIHVVGGLPRLEQTRRARAIDMDRVVLPLHNAAGEVAAHLAAVPFLRAADLPRDAEGPTDDVLIEGVRQVYAEVLDAARERCGPGQALLAAGHCYMVGTEISGLSERRVLGGNQHALPVDIFPDDVAYVALGHLHKAQRVGGRENVRYSGAPLALAMNEARYRHQVCVVELRGKEVAEIRQIPVPRVVDMVRVPGTGAAPPDEVITALEQLDDWDGKSEPDTRPYLEVCVRLERPEVQLRQLVEQALAGKRPRLVKLGIEYTGNAAALGDIVEINLRDIDPQEVFLRRYARDHEDEPAPELVAAFHELLDQVKQEERA